MAFESRRSIWDQLILLIMFAKPSCKVNDRVNAQLHEHVVVGNEPFFIIASTR